MTQDEIIEMARQAARHNTILDRDDIVEGDLVMLYFDELEAFAKLVAAKEREEIAQFIDSTELGTLPDVLKAHYARMLSFYSSQIRARGEA